MNRKIFPGIAVTIIGIMMLMTSCQVTPDSYSERPPELPPFNSKEMDFSIFDPEESQKYASPDRVAENKGYGHFGNAAVRVLIMKTVVNVNLAIPRELLRGAEQVESDFNGNEEWVWSYSKSVEGEIYEVRLIASMENENKVLWRLYVTKQGLDNQLLFQGTTTPGRNSGRWSYYRLQGDDSENAVSEVSWIIMDEENAFLRLEILSDRHGQQGDFIEYQHEHPTKRASYFNAEKGSKTLIEWNTDTREGQLIVPGYNNGKQACWGADLKNIACDLKVLAS